MKRPYLAVGLATALAVAALVNMPASAAPVTQATTTSPPSDIREVPVDKQYSTAELGLGQVSGALRPRPPWPPRPPTPRPSGPSGNGSASTTSTGSCTARTTRCAASATTSRSGSPTISAFPAGDCRAQIPTSTTVTDAQVADLVTEFDTNMYPKETSHLQHASRPGRHATPSSGPIANGNGGVYTGGGDKTVALVDNVRDDNFYTFPAAPTYIAGSSRRSSTSCSTATS